MNKMDVNGPPLPPPHQKDSSVSKKLPGEMSKTNNQTIGQSINYQPDRGRQGPMLLNWKLVKSLCNRYLSNSGSMTNLMMTVKLIVIPKLMMDVEDQDQARPGVGMSRPFGGPLPPTRSTGGQIPSFLSSLDRSARI